MRSIYDSAITPAVVLLVSHPELPACLLLLQCGCIACLENLGSIGNGLLIFTMVMENAGQWNESNRVSSMGKRHTDCPTHPPSLSANGIRLKDHDISAIFVLVSLLNGPVNCSV